MHVSVHIVWIIVSAGGSGKWPGINTYYTCYTWHGTADVESYNLDGLDEGYEGD